MLGVYLLYCGWTSLQNLQCILLEHFEFPSGIRVQNACTNARLCQPYIAVKHFRHFPPELAINTILENCGQGLGTYRLLLKVRIRDACHDLVPLLACYCQALTQTWEFARWYPQYLWD